MKPGDILLFKAESNLIAKLIKWGTDSAYSHVAICVSPEMNLAVEAVPGGGVRACDIRTIEGQFDIYRVKPGFAYDLNGVISFLVGHLNMKYDTFGVAWLGVLKLGYKLGKTIRNAANNWQKDRDYFCSELCYAAFSDGGGLDIVPQVSEADITSPGDIAKSNVIEKV